MQQHNLSRTQPRTMSDGDICSNNKKYGGFGAMMPNVLRCQEESQEERERRITCSLFVFATKTTIACACGQESPPCHSHQRVQDF